jgi:hypothetical protein
MRCAILLGAVAAACLAAEPAVSPSIEADAEYLLTTTDFMQAQFGMNLEVVNGGPERVVLRTTGAGIAFTPGTDTIQIRQRLGQEREAAQVTFPAGTLAGLRVTRSGTGAALLANGAGTLELRVNADSLIMARSTAPLAVRCLLGFDPASVRRTGSDALLLDEWGAVGIYLATGSGRIDVSPDARTITTALAPRQVLWLSVGPPRPYDWDASFKDRVAWHWSMQTGYPPDADIKAWSAYGNILLQQSEVMLWKDWSLRFIPRNGLEEFQRVNRTCERYGMRNIVYTSPFYFLTGTGLESKAMNNFDNFATNGFSPGDDRGLNWPIFLSEITKVMRDYQPDGLYFDGIYGNVVRTYLIARKAREVVGDRGLLEYHATGSPPGGGCYLPQIDTYFNFILRGEGSAERYTDPDYLRYFVSTYNISNAIGVLCNNNDFPLDEKFLNILLDNNIRLHYLLGGPQDPRTQAMTRYYWPALNAALPARVGAAAGRRQTEFVALRREVRQALETPMTALRLIWQEGFTDPALSATLPVPAPEKGAEIALPGGWTAFLGAGSGATLRSAGGVLTITARANTTAILERVLPPETVAVECRIRGDGECGASWGPALCLRAGDSRARIGARSDDRLQSDRPGDQTLFEGYPKATWYWVRLRLAGRFVLPEVSRDGRDWTCLSAEPLALPAGPRRLLVGKVPYDGGRADYPQPGEVGTVQIADIKVYAAAGQP